MSITIQDKQNRGWNHINRESTEPLAQELDNIEKQTAKNQYSHLNIPLMLHSIDNTRRGISQIN